MKQFIYLDKQGQIEISKPYLKSWSIEKYGDCPFTIP